MGNKHRLKKKLLLCSLLILAIIQCGFLVQVVQAGSIDVGVYDASGTLREIFGVGEDIRIIASSSDKPITIVILDPDGIVVHTETVDAYDYNKILSGLTTKLGWYTVEASSPIDIVRKNYGCTFFHVIPEIPLGTLGSLATLILGLGYWRRKNE